MLSRLISLCLVAAWVVAAGDLVAGATPTQRELRKPNRLIREKSPYLLQHAYNPVDWYPWSDEAFEKARREQKPIFLSIGYSTCHWCHVMEKESFSDTKVAELMNDAFVNVKVDREERPDVDAVYIRVAELMTGSAGWPLNIVMTPDQKPFFADTYIPKDDRFGKRGMMTLVPALGRAWRERRDQLTATADTVAATLLENARGAAGDGHGRETLDRAFSALRSRFDQHHGGFLPAPKFPRPQHLLFLLRYWKRTGDSNALAMTRQTLDAMRRGGIYDHVGFGFHRYSVNADWSVPHFEKTLYDQALLAIAFIEAYQASGNAAYRRTADEMFIYVLRDLRSPEGAFYSAEDADTEGEEGKFYRWSKDEIRQAVGEDSDLFLDVYRVDASTALHLPRPLTDIAKQRKMTVEQLTRRIEASRQKLFAAREKRTRPHRDDKILTDWNGLMIAALARAAQAFGEPQHAKAAADAAEFLLRKMRRKDGLLHRYRDGDAAISGNLDDYAFLTWGLLELYEATWETRWLEAAVALADEAIQRFRDEEGGGFYFTAHRAEKLLIRPKESRDEATPSGNSVMLMNLLRLGRITANTHYELVAQRVLRAFSRDISDLPDQYTFMLSGLDFALGPSFEIAIVGDPSSRATAAMLREIFRPYLPNKVVILKPSGKGEAPIIRVAPFTEPLEMIDGKPTAYVCTNYVCKFPTNELTVLRKQLGLGGS